MLPDERMVEGWEYKSWPLYDVCMGCGAAYSSMHASECHRPGRRDIEVVAAICPDRDALIEEGATAMGFGILSS